MSSHPSPSPNILVLRLSSLGDIVLTVPVYKNLKAHWPECRITVMVKPAYRALLEGHPCVDATLPFDNLREALRRVRSGRFTHLLDLHANLRSAWLGLLSGIPNVSRYRKDALPRRLFVGLGWHGPSLTRHTVDRYLDALRAWGIPTPVRSLELGDYRGAAIHIGAGNLLLVQTAFLGDATLTVPLARAIKAHAPRSRLHVLCRPDTAELFRSCGWVDEVLTTEKRRGPLGLASLLPTVRRLRSGRHDLAIVPHRSLRSALMVRLAGIPRRIGFSSSAGNFLFTQTLPFAWGMHDLERNLGLILPSGEAASQATRPVYLQAPADGTARSVAARLLQAGLDPARPLIGVHPGSVWPTKRWPADRYATLIRRLSREAGADVVLIGAAADSEQASRITRGAPALDWTGRTSLGELIALMGRLALFVTNDSGPMHIAAACGVATLAIFGPTTRELGFFPYGPGHRVLETDLNCRPCGLHGRRACPEGHFLCMRLITVEQAFRCASEMLRAGAKTTRETA